MAKPFSIVITDFVADDLSPEKQIAGDLADVVALNAFSEKEIAGKVEHCDALIMYHTLSLTKTTLSQLRNCKLIVRAGVGVDNVDHALARELGIPVANIPDYGSEDVADTAMGMMLTLMRGIHYMNSKLQRNEGDWSYTQVQPLSRLRTKTLGIIGLGRIGTAMALRAKAFGFTVIFFDPFKQDGFDKALGIKRSETLQQLLEQCDAVSLHCPLTPLTKHMIDVESLRHMRGGSYLVNTARGAIVNTAAVLDALENGKLAGAAFDVLEQEPPVDDPLVAAWKNPAHIAHHKAIINPHAAFYSEEGFMEIRNKSIQACMNVLQGKQIRNIVNAG